MPVPAPAPLDLQGLTSDQLVAAAAERVERGRGRARALYRAAVGEGRFEPAEHGLSPRSAAAWRRAFRFELPPVVAERAEDTPVGVTAKVALRLRDGLTVEMVHVPMGRGRHTVCISSQVGCKMGCGFCETGRMGLLRQLSAAEIVSQVLVARHALGWPVRNVVFMGMGEALDNFDALVQAIDVLTDPGGLAMAQERLTVCTVGHVEGIRRLAERRYKRLNLSVSLNAANDATRSELMPVNRKAPLAALSQALRAYRPRRNFCLGVNYCLIPGRNDARSDATDVARFCRPLERVMVNLIPYNPGTSPVGRAPTDAEVERFVGWLRDEGLPVRRRTTKGRKVMAACGQLGDPTLRLSARRARR